MKKEKLIAGLYVAAVYAVGIFYGYKMGVTKGKADAYLDAAHKLDEVFKVRDEQSEYGEEGL